MKYKNNNGYMTKESLFEITEGGWKYLEKKFSGLEKRGKNKSNLVLNHLRGEKNPSLSFECSNGVWYGRDFGSPTWKGSAIDFYAKEYGIEDVRKNFSKILGGIYEFTFEEKPPQYKSSENQSIFSDGYLEVGKTFSYTERDFENLTLDEKAFLKKYKLSIETMRKLNMIFLKDYTFISKKGKTLQINSVGDKILIGHKVDGFLKVYKPNNDTFKYQCFGNKPKNYIVGRDRFEKLHERITTHGFNQKDAEIKIIICAGGKDCLILNEIGLVAFSFNSETTTYIPDYIFKCIREMNEVLNNPVEIIVAYDNDQTGYEMKGHIQDKFEKKGINCSVLDWPQTEEYFEINDIADLVESGIEEEKLLKFVVGSNYNKSAHLGFDELEEMESAISSVSPQKEIKLRENNESLKKLKSIKERSLKKEVVEEILQPIIVSEETFGVEDIFKRLPIIFQKMCEPFEPYLKVMMLLSFITSTASILRNVKGNYRNDDFFVNIFTCIIAPPASGKSFMKWARHIIMPIENFLIKESLDNKKEYDHQQELVKQGELEYEDVMEEPPFRLQLIPADITSSMWMLQLNENDGYGLMYDTEIDSLVNANASQKNFLSDKLRKISENEPLSLMRKTDRERILIEEGIMSLLLSGTPRQFTDLIKDTENGLFSRIIPFVLKGNSSWIDSLKTENINYKEHFDVLSKDVLELFKVLYGRDSSITFKFSNQQFKRLDEKFRIKLSNSIDEVGLDARASILRLATITLKIAIVLSSFRLFENNNLKSINQCEDVDFDIALSLSDVISESIIDVIKKMNNDRIENSYRGIKLDYFYALSKSFTYSDSQELAQEMGIKLRTAQKWVYKFRDDGFLANPEKGKFIKIE